LAKPRLKSSKTQKTIRFSIGLSFVKPRQWYQRSVAGDHMHMIVKHGLTGAGAAIHRQIIA